MVSLNLLKELKEILESVKGRKFSDAEIEEAARLYLGYFGLAQTISKRPDYGMEKIREGVYVWKKL